MWSNWVDFEHNGWGFFIENVGGFQRSSTLVRVTCQYHSYSVLIQNKIAIMNFKIFFFTELAPSTPTLKLTRFFKSHIWPLMPHIFHIVYGAIIPQNRITDIFTKRKDRRTLRILCIDITTKLYQIFICVM